MKKGLKITLIVLGSLILVYGILALVNLFCNLSLRNYIKEKCTKVEIENQLEAKYDSERGHYYFELDSDTREFKVLQLTDLHFGGGFLSYKKDKKTIDDVYYIIKETKPDLVISTGDNVFAIPYISGTFNNKMATKTVLSIFENAGVYYTSAFGNHDTEVFDYTNRKDLAKVYEEGKYSCFKSEIQTVGENGLYSVSNQMIYILNKDGSVNKALFTIDTNAYKDDSIKSVLDWTYDTIRKEDIEYLKKELVDLENELNSGNKIQSLFFHHMPIAEYEIGYEDYINGNTDILLGGYYDEVSYDDYGIEGNSVRIWYGRCYDNTDILKIDNLYEEFEGRMIGSFCGHDHVNCASINYNGVVLSYSYSIDNLAYSNVNYSGLQRGCTLIKIDQNNTMIEHLNLYTDLYKNYVDDNVYIDKLYYTEYDNGNIVVTPEIDFSNGYLYPIIIIDKDGKITKLELSYIK